MAKIKILKKLPKSKIKYKKNEKIKKQTQKEDKFKDNYLKFYDDIKIPSRRYDW